MATAQKKTTTLDDDNTKPSVTAPGDGPADTTDPTERASTVLPNPSAATIASGAGTVNSAVPAPSILPPEKPEGEPRIEVDTVVTPEGKTMQRRRNLETGESRLSAVTDTGSVATQSGR